MQSSGDGNCALCEVEKPVTAFSLLLPRPATIGTRRLNEKRGNERVVS